VNLLKSDIGVAQAEDLVSILKEHPTLKSLCGNNGNETELDMSGKLKGAADAIMLVPEIIDNGALLVLSLESSVLKAAGGKALAEGLKGNQVITELNISNNELGYNSNYGADASGVVALADVISHMGALTSLDISSNALVGFNLPAGWSGPDADGEFKSPDGSYEKCPPVEAEAILNGIIALANAIPDMGALAKLMFGDKQVVTMTTEMTEANFSGKLKSYEAQIVAAFLPKCT
jgi:hypothetical protein